MKIVFELPELEIALFHDAKHEPSFKLTYGKETTVEMNMANAAKSLGSCILHALQSEGKLDGN